MSNESPLNIENSKLDICLTAQWLSACICWQAGSIFFNIQFSTLNAECPMKAQWTLEIQN